MAKQGCEGLVKIALIILIVLAILFVLHKLVNRVMMKEKFETIESIESPPQDIPEGVKITQSTDLIIHRPYMYLEKDENERFLRPRDELVTMKYYDIMPINRPEQYFSNVRKILRIILKKCNNDVPKAKREFFDLLIHNKETFMTNQGACMDKDTTDQVFKLIHYYLEGEFCEVFTLLDRQLYMYTIKPQYVHQGLNGTFQLYNAQFGFYQTIRCVAVTMSATIVKEIDQDGKVNMYILELFLVNPEPKYISTYDEDQNLADNQVGTSMPWIKPYNIPNQQYDFRGFSTSSIGNINPYVPSVSNIDVTPPVNVQNMANFANKEYSNIIGCKNDYIVTTIHAAEQLGSATN